MFVAATFDEGIAEPNAAVSRPKASKALRIAVSITLQSTIGGFSAEFMRKLPAVERAMVAHGLEPSHFVISKDRSASASVPVIGPFFYDYTVFFGEESFTVTEPNDIGFLEYFYQRCIEDRRADAGARRGVPA